MWNPFTSKRVTPSKVATDRVIPVHFFDDTTINKALVMRFMLRFDDVLDPEKLRGSLERLLNRDGWTKLGARVRLNDKGKLDYHIPVSYSEDRPSFLYSHVDHDMSISEHKLASQLPHATEVPSIVSESLQFLPLMDGPNWPREMDDYLYADIPQLVLRIVSFDDATIVTLAWPHTFLDALGRKALLEAWTLVLSGREDEVPPLAGVDHDPLAELGTRPTEPYKIQHYMLSTWQMVIFGVRYVFDLMLHQEETHTICVPAATIKSLRENAMQELISEKSSQTFLSEGDILCAWWSRHAIQDLPQTSTQTITIFNAYGLRALLAKDLLPPSAGVYIANCVLGVYAPLRAQDIFNWPLSKVALAVRKSITELGTREQIEALAAINRERLNKGGMTAIFGDATMRMITYTNWTKGNFFQLDFSPAVVNTNEGSGSRTLNRSNKIGRPSYIQPHGYAKGFSTRNAMGIVGKDASGNYWLNGCLRKSTWSVIEKSLALEVAENSDL